MFIQALIFSYFLLSASGWFCSSGQFLAAWVESLVPTAAIIVWDGQRHIIVENTIGSAGWCGSMG